MSLKFYFSLFLFLISFSNNFATEKKIYLKIEKNSKEGLINLKLLLNKNDINSKDQIKYRYYKLENPKREVLDIFYDKNYELKFLEEEKNKISLNNFIFKNVDENYRTAHHNFGFRIVFNVKKSNVESSIEEKKQINNLLSLNKIIITIDPGHGGKDPGAIAILNKKTIKEKDLTLKYSVALKKELEMKNFKVFLTRSEDKFLPLEQRVAIARKNLSNLMISIHIDQAPNKNFYGTTIYAIDDIDFNHQDSFRFNNFNYTPLNILQKKSDISKIIIHLMHKETKMNSDYIANEIINSLLLEKKIKRCYKKSQSFAVLRATDMPAILIEIGYLSNESEAKKIIDEIYIKDFVKSLSNAIIKLYVK
jgi:N-acetylmuramoyl-L-alanine amidase